MTVTLPIVGNSSGVWGTILNTTLTEMDGRIVTNTTTTTANGTSISTINGQITTINGKITTLEAKPPGGLIVGTTGTLPAVAVGQITLATDTGYLSYGASIAGTPTRVPFPGSYVGTIRQSIAQNMAYSTDVKILFDRVEADRLSGYNSGQKTRYTCQVPGIYEFTGGVTWAANGTGMRKVYLYVNGAQCVSGSSGNSAVQTYVSSVNLRPTTVKLNKFDYVEMAALHTAGTPTGVSLSTFIDNDTYLPNLSVKYLGYQP